MGQESDDYADRDPPGWLMTVAPFLAAAALYVIVAGTVIVAALWCGGFLR